MKTAGKAFTTGVFGTLGVGVAILGTVGIAVHIGERKLKKIFREFEESMRKRTEDLLTEDHHDRTRLPDDPECTCGHEKCWDANHHSDHCAYKEAWFNSWEEAEVKPPGWQEMYIRIHGNR